MRRITLMFLPMLLVSLGAMGLCSAQQNPFNRGPEVNRWEIDMESGQLWPVDRDRGFLGRRFERVKSHRVPISLPGGRMLKPEEENTILGIIKNDFLVNDDTIGECWQSSPAIAMDDSGNFVICWTDGRNDFGDIYAQRYSNSGEPLGTNFRVNEDARSRTQWNPAIAMDTGGNFVICWGDYRNGNWDIYAQRYSSSGDKLGGNFLVNDYPGTTGYCEGYSPAIAMDAGGDFIICWQDYRNGDGDIYAQRYSSTGDPLGANFRVNDDVGASFQYYPSIAMDADGDFAICWQDLRNGDGDIYAQRYSSTGDPLGANFQVNDDVGSSWQRYPSVAMEGDGGFVICWEDERNDNWDIYAQRYSSTGDPLGANFQVNDDVGSSWQWLPSIAMEGDGGFIICWQDLRNGDLDIYAQRYSSTGNPLEANFQVNDDMGSSGQWYPSVAMEGDGGFIICWADGRNGDWDIYAQRYSSTGTPLGANFRVNDDVGSSWQRYPSVAMEGDGGFVICWEDERNDNWDIYAQRYSSTGDPLGANFQVNDDVGSSWQRYPSVAMEGDGGFVICWEDERNDNWDIYAQRYSSTGNPLGANFQVNDDVGTSLQCYPSIAMDNIGDFVICWQDWRNDNWDIYTQRYSSTGDPLGANFRVNDDVGTSLQCYPSIAMDNIGDFVICWQDERNGVQDIYAQRFNNLGEALGANFKVNNTQGTSSQRYYHSKWVAMDGVGRFVICWEDERNGGLENLDVYAQRYDSLGNPLGNNFRVNDDTGISYQGCPSIAMDADGDFLICWEDCRNGDGDIYAQRYHSDGTPLGTNYLVNQKPDVLNLDQWWPAVALENQTVTFTWQDARRSKGWDIYAKVVTWDWVKVDEPVGNGLGLPREYALSQNYPNPFNPITQINYALPRDCWVRLEVYNILGQKVATMVDGHQEAGYKIARWDAGSFSSGIYFYRLQAGDFVGTRKMVLLR